MPVRITLRKKDLEILAAVDEVGLSLDFSAKQMKLWSSFYERVLAAEMKPRKKASGLTVAQAIEIFRGALGRRLVVPAGTPGPEWFIALQRRINSSGLTAELAKAAAETAGATWKGSIKAESIIRQADTLLSDSNRDYLGASLPAEAVDMTEL